MSSRTLPPIALITLSTFWLTACGTTPKNCSYTADIAPITATLNHNQLGNSVTYTTTVTVPAGCSPPPLPAPVWTISNTDVASISQSGVATCKASFTTPLQISAGTAYNTATLVCQ